MDGPFEEWFSQIPTITKAYLVGCVAITLAVQLDVIHPLHLYLNFTLVAPPHYEVWRLITNFLFFDYLGLSFFFHLFFVIRHSRLLEENSFHLKTSDYLYFWIYCCSSLLLIDFFSYMTGFLPKIMFLAPSLSFAIVYLWSRRNPRVTMSFLGLFAFKAPYLPWVVLGFGCLLQQSPLFDALGILVGHVYYFFKDVYPQIHPGRDLFKTPRFLEVLFDDAAADIPRIPVTEFMRDAAGVDGALGDAAPEGGDHLHHD